MAKKTKRYDDGGIVVQGRRMASPEFSAFDSFDLGRMTGNMPNMDGGGGGLGMMGGGTGGGASQRMPTLTPPATPQSRMPVTPAVVRQQPSGLGSLMGDRGTKGYGARARFGFAEGGEAKKKSKPKKMAKGGSTASKRADGCATKGKTKGRFV